MIVFDDDEAMVGFMATVASRRGWMVQTATRVSVFQGLVRAAPPDAIMLDLQLGVSDGIEQLHFMHQHDYTGAIVLMSGFDARVLASAQQIGDSLGWRLPRWWRSRRAWNAFAMRWRRLNGIRGCIHGRCRRTKCNQLGFCRRL